MDVPCADVQFSPNNDEKAAGPSTKINNSVCVVGIEIVSISYQENFKLTSLKHYYVIE